MTMLYIEIVKKALGIKMEEVKPHLLGRVKYSGAIDCVEKIITSHCPYYYLGDIAPDYKPDESKCPTEYSKWLNIRKPELCIHQDISGKCIKCWEGKADSYLERLSDFIVSILFNTKDSENWVDIDLRYIFEEFITENFCPNEFFSISSNRKVEGMVNNDLNDCSISCDECWKRLVGLNEHLFTNDNETLISKVKEIGGILVFNRNRRKRTN